MQLCGVRHVQLGDDCGPDGGRYRCRRHAVHPDQGGELLGVSDAKAGQAVYVLSVKYGAERHLAFHHA